MRESVVGMDVTGPRMVKKLIQKEMALAYPEAAVIECAVHVATANNTGSC